MRVIPIGLETASKVQLESGEDGIADGQLLSQDIVRVESSHALGVYKTVLETHLILYSIVYQA